MLMNLDKDYVKKKINNEFHVKDRKTLLYTIWIWSLVGLFIWLRFAVLLYILCIAKLKSH